MKILCVVQTRYSTDILAEYEIDINPRYQNEMNARAIAAEKYRATNPPDTDWCVDSCKLED